MKEFSMTGKERVENCRMLGMDFFFKFGLPVYKKIFDKSKSEEDAEELNDVCIYETLLYPPKSTPPTAN